MRFILPHSVMWHPLPAAGIVGLTIDRHVAVDDKLHRCLMFRPRALDLTLSRLFEVIMRLFPALARSQSGFPPFRLYRSLLSLALVSCRDTEQG